MEDDIIIGDVTYDLTSGTIAANSSTNYSVTIPSKTGYEPMSEILGFIGGGGGLDTHIHYKPRGVGANNNLSFNLSNSYTSAITFSSTKNVNLIWWIIYKKS